MSKKLHIWDAGDVTRSVLDGVRVTALCGLTKRIRREEVDKNVRDVKVCRGCQDAQAELARKHDVLIRKRSGWVGHLEAEARSATTASFRIEGSTRTWSSSGDWTFPLAG